MATPRIQETLTYQVDTTNDNHTHIVRDGANRVLLVEMMGRFASVTSISYGGNALTQVVGADAGAGAAGTTHRHVDLWYLIAPAVGSATLNVQISGNTQGTVRVRNLIDVDQSTPLRSQGGSNYAVSASGTSSTGDTLTPTTAADDLVLDLIAVSTTPTIGSGQTLAGFGTQPTNQRSSTRVATGGSENMAWTYSSGTFAHCAVSIIGSAATQPDPADFGGTAGKKSWHVSSTLTGESVSSGATVYVSLAPGIESSGTESLNRTRIRVPGTISGLSLTVSVNATTSDSTVTVLEDGASTGVTITIPAGTTGTFAASGDVSVDGTTALSLQVTNGGGGSLTMTASSFAFEADDAETMTLLAAHSSSALQTSAATTTYLRASGSRGSDPDETDATIRVPIAATWEGIEVIKVGNTTTATVDVASRISGANGNQALSWVSSGASSEEDTTNSDTLADGDDIAWQIVAGAGSGTWETERWTSRLLTSNGRFLFVAGGVPGDGLALSNGLNYIPLAGELKVTTTEANAQQEAPFDLTAYRLAVAVGTNTSLLPTMVRLRVNGADASQWVELQPGIADVYYADVWATDDVDAGDLVCIEADCAGANSTVRIRYVALVGVERSAAPSLPSLSASTYKPGTLTSTGWTPRVTAT